MTERPVPLANVFFLGVRDLPVLRAFSRRLGWPQVVDAEDFAAFELRGAVLALFPIAQLAQDAQAPPAPQQESIRCAIGITVDQPEAVDALTERVRHAGGRISKAPSAAQFFAGRSAYVADPENALVAAAQRAARQVG